MGEEKNPLNVYNQLDIIKDALAQIETIHIYELANRQYGTSTEDELKNRIRELDKEVLEYELQLAELQAYIDSVLDSNKRLLEANNQLISEKNLALENRQLTQDQADKIVSTYHQLPWIVKKFYGVN
jgi:adenine C2-methylase RlmN of 23S rRNA A2503 and tRNA A37